MEQIGSEYNFKTGGSIKALNDLIAKVEELDKQVNKLDGDTKKAGDGLNNLPKKTQGAVKGFDALGNSINQVTREFPAFAFSAQTGFLAVSNNIPILLDSINQLKQANIDLAKEGKATIPVFKQIISSLFSWQTALSLAISFTVLYGKEIGNLIGSLFKGSQAINSAKMSFDALNRAYESKSVAQAIEDTYLMAAAFEQAKKDASLQKAVLDEYNKTLNKGNIAQTDFNKASQEFIDQSKDYIKAAISRSAVNILSEDAAKEFIQLEKIKKQREFNARELSQLNESLSKNDKDAAMIRQFNLVAAAENQQKIYDKQIKDLETNLENRRSLINELSKNFTIVTPDRDREAQEALRLAEELAKKQKAILAKRVQDELNIAQEAYIKEISAKDATNEKKEQAEIRLLEAQRDIFEKYKQFDEKFAQDSLDTREKLAEKKLSIEEKARAEYLKGLKEEYDADNKFMQKTIDDELDAIKEKYANIRENAVLSRKEQLMLDLQETEDTISKLEVVKEASEKQSDQLVALKKKQGKLVSEINKETNDEILAQDKKRLEEQRLLAQEGIQVLGTFSNGFFDLRKSQLEEETNIQLNELEKQKEAKSITEEEFQIKRKQLLTEQAQKQRQYDLAQIRVETALAIMKTFAQFGYPAGIPLALLAAAQGAIQYSFASAQPLPQFAKGTDRVIGGTKGKDSVHALLMPDEAVIPTKENMARPGLAKAWINGNLDSHLMMNYIKPAIDENNRKWEAVLKVNQNSTFIRNDNFNDKRIVRGLDRINRKLSTTNVIKTNRKGLWN